MNVKKKKAFSNRWNVLVFFPLVSTQSSMFYTCPLSFQKALFSLIRVHIYILLFTHSLLGYVWLPMLQVPVSPSWQMSMVRNFCRGWIRFLQFNFFVWYRTPWSGNGCLSWEKWVICSKAPVSG